jgi:YVTN family beta-propeller protein
MRSPLLCTEICFSNVQYCFLFLIILISVLSSSPRAMAQGNWPMPGHDAQRTGRANYAGPTSAPSSPSWIFSTRGAIVGDITTSAEGKIYFASDKLYALNQDGTSFVPAATIGTAATGPIVDDVSGMVYVAVSAADGGLDLLSFTKQLQGESVLLHIPRPANGVAIISPLLLGRGVIYFVAGMSPGVVYAAGAAQWSNPVCQGESGQNTPFGVTANGPALFNDGSSLVVMCGTPGTNGNLFKLDPFAGTQIASTSGGERNLTEPTIDSLNHIHSGWQAFGGAIFCGDYLTWDSSLTLLTPAASSCDSRFTTSRASVFPDGTSTVRIGFAFPPNNQLAAEGAYDWIIATDNSTVPNFSSVPAVDAAGNIFIGNTQGVESLSSADGHTLWSFSTGDAITTQPVIANGGALYVGSSSGKVYAFNASPLLNSGTVYLTGSGLDTIDLSRASVVNRNEFDAGGVLSVSPDGTRTYMSATFGLAVVDNATNQVITTVPVGSRPEWITVSPDGSRIYASQNSVGIYVIDAVSNAIIATIPIPGPQEIGIAPDNSRLYVGSQGRGIAVVDPSTNVVTHFINILGANPIGIAFTPDSAHAYVGEFFSPSLYLIDARADALMETVPLAGALGGGVGGVISSPDGKKIYAAHIRISPVDPSRNVFVVDTTTNLVSGQIPVSFPSPEMAITTDGASLLVGDSDIGELIVASIATDSVIETVRINNAITGVGTKPPPTLIPPPPLIGRLSVPTLINAGAVQQGTTMAFPVQLQNVGTGSLTITAFSIDNAAFQLSGVPLLPLTIPAGNSFGVSLLFAPLSVGTFSGSLSITLAGNATAVTVVLSGVSVAPPILSVQTLSLDFGRTSTAETRKLSLTLSNPGGSTLSGAASIPDTSEGTFSLLGNTSFALAPGQSLDLTIAFTAIDNIAYTGVLSLTSNAGDVTVMLSGRGEHVAVLLVVGFNGDANTFGLMKDFLAGDNTRLKVFSFNAPNSLFDDSPPACHPKDAPEIQRVAGEMADCISQITARGFDRVDIVAHSMGGLAARTYIANGALQNGSQVAYRGDIRKLITVGTPNYGIPFFTIDGLGGLNGFLGSRIQVAEMIFDAGFLVALDNSWRQTVIPQKRIDPSDILLIVGTQTSTGSLFPGFADDGVVPAGSATLPCEFVPCDADSSSNHVRYVPYKHSPNVPLPIYGVAEVDVESPESLTLQTVEDFILERPFRSTFTPPSEFTENGLLQLEFVDAKTQRAAELPGLSVGVFVDGVNIPFTAVNIKTGAVTAWPLKAGLHIVSVNLLSFRYDDPPTFVVSITGGRPTVQIVPLQKR